MPPSYGDFSKTVGDLLSDDYGDKKSAKMKFKTEPVMGDAVTVTAEVPQKGNNLAGKLSAKWKHSCGLSVDKLTYDPKGPVVECSYAKLPVKGLKITSKIDTNKKEGDIGCEFDSDTVNAALKAKVSKDKLYESADASIVIGVEGLQVGGELSFEEEALPKDWKIGIGYAKKAYFASLQAMDQLSKFSLALMHKPSPKLTVACLGTSELDFAKDKPNSIEVGCAYKYNDKATVKSKYLYAVSQSKTGAVTKNAICGAVNYSALKKVVLTCGVEIPISSMSDFKTYKSGLTFTLG